MKEELLLSLSRTAALVSHEMEQRLRPFGLSATQYNVLRILRGAGPRGLCQYEIRDRLVAPVPDVPRILERMELAGWVNRTRGKADRRMVLATATETGLSLLRELEGPILTWMEGAFHGLDGEECARLSDLLAKARALRADGHDSLAALRTAPSSLHAAD